MFCKKIPNLTVAFCSDLSEGEPAELDEDDQFLIHAPHGIRLVELWDKKHCEVYQHWEFLRPDPPSTFTLSRTEANENASTVLVEDDKGNIFRTGFAYDYSKII